MEENEQNQEVKRRTFHVKQSAKMNETAISFEFKLDINRYSLSFHD